MPEVLNEALDEKFLRLKGCIALYDTSAAVDFADPECEAYIRLLPAQCMDSNKKK